MPLGTALTVSPSAPVTGLVPPTVSGGSSSNGYLSQTGVDLNVVGTWTDTLVLSNHTTAAVQMTPESGAVSAFSGSLQGSIDGVSWIDTGKTFTAAGITTAQDVTVYKLLRVYIATANGAALLARISILAKTV